MCCDRCEVASCTGYGTPDQAGLADASVIDRRALSSGHKLRLVLDNLNTHTGASLYEAFPPHEARRLLDRLEFHHTPKHASWLNMAEIESAF